MADLFFKLLEHGIGNSVQDLRDNYTIDQIYLFYTKVRRSEMDEYRMRTIILAEALMATTPKHDRQSAQKSTRAFKKFVDSLTWEKVVNKNKKISVKGANTAFTGIGIPIKKV